MKKRISKTIKDPRHRPYDAELEDYLEKNHIEKLDDGELEKAQEFYKMKKNNSTVKFNNKTKKLVITIEFE